MIVKIFSYCLVLVILANGGNVMAFYYGDVGQPRHDEAHIGQTAIVMPLGYLLLVRQDAEYCAINFTKAWSENTSEVGSMFVASGSDEYAIYNSWYQGDKSGDFSNKNVEFKTGKLSLSKPRGIGRLAFSSGNKEIKCGSIKLLWSGNGSIHFYSKGQEQGDYGIELAPTPWTDITKVNVFDPRIKWYRYDENRKRINIPIDKLWEDTVSSLF